MTLAQASSYSTRLFVMKRECCVSSLPELDAVSARALAFWARDDYLAEALQLLVVSESRSS